MRQPPVITCTPFGVFVLLQRVVRKHACARAHRPSCRVRRRTARRCCGASATSRRRAWARVQKCGACRACGSRASARSSRSTATWQARLPRPPAGRAEPVPFHRPGPVGACSPSTCMLAAPLCMLAAPSFPSAPTALSHGHAFIRPRLTHPRRRCRRRRRTPPRASCR